MPHKKYHPQGSSCPSCGTAVRGYSFWESFTVISAKNKVIRQEKKLGNPPSSTVPAKAVPSPRTQISKPTSPTSVPPTSRSFGATPARPALPPRKTIQETQLQNIQANLGLLEGEAIKLSYWVLWQTEAPPSMWYNLIVGVPQQPRLESRRGMMVFTTDNMIWMQQEAVGNDFDPALRIPLGEISGVVAGGTFVPHIRLNIGTSGTTHARVSIQH